MNRENGTYKFEKHNLVMNINIPMALDPKCKYDEDKIFEKIIRIATVEVNKTYYARIIKQHRFEYPSNWIEAIKERFFTKKMKKKWPIKTEIIIIDIEEWTDQIVAPGGFATLTVVRNYKNQIERGSLK